MSVSGVVKVTFHEDSNGWSWPIESYLFPSVSYISVSGVVEVTFHEDSNGYMTLVAYPPDSKKTKHKRVLSPSSSPSSSGEGAQSDSDSESQPLSQHKNTQQQQRWVGLYCENIALDCFGIWQWLQCRISLLSCLDIDLCHTWVIHDIIYFQPGNVLIIAVEKIIPLPGLALSYVYWFQSSSDHLISTMTWTEVDNSTMSLLHNAHYHLNGRPTLLTVTTRCLIDRRSSGLGWQSTTIILFYQLYLLNSCPHSCHHATITVSSW